MNVALIDIDSKIPNLALMKISSFMKLSGHNPILIQCHGNYRRIPRFEFSWISSIFTWNRDLAKRIQSEQSASALGGSGIDLHTELPPIIESYQPDYFLYKNENGNFDDRAIGFVQRGCIRKCEGCVVPLKEGPMKNHPLRPIETWNMGFKKILLLDNEFAMCSLEKETIETAKRNKWKISITQGYDLRCVTSEKAELLASWKPYDLKFKERRLYTAWDYIAIQPYVEKGIQILISKGFKGYEIMCYCLIGLNTTHLQDYYRFHILWKKYKVHPFMMRYNMIKSDPFINALTRFVDRGPASYRNHTFLDYVRDRNPNLESEVIQIMDQVDKGDIPMNSERIQLPMASWY